jgi:flagellar protein FliS
MMLSARAANQYVQTQVGSSQPLELVVMLYDAALGASAAARDALVRRDIPARKAAMSRAFAIVAELQNTLDMERGGTIAIELDRLYTWITSQFVQATVRQDVRALDNARRVLEILRGAWQQIAVKPATEQAP